MRISLRPPAIHGTRSSGIPFWSHPHFSQHFPHCRHSWVMISSLQGSVPETLYPAHTRRADRQLKPSHTGSGTCRYPLIAAPVCPGVLPMGLCSDRKKRTSIVHTNEGVAGYEVLRSALIFTDPFGAVTDPLLTSVPSSKISTVSFLPVLSPF